MLITITKHGSVGYKVSANKNKGKIAHSKYASDFGEVAAIAAHMAITNRVPKSRIIGPSFITELIPSFEI